MNDQMIAQGAMLTNQQLAKVLQGIAPLFKQAEQVIQAKMPKPPMPPEITASLEIAKAETARKAEYDKATFAMKTQENNVKAQQEQQQRQFEQAMEAAQMQAAEQKAAFEETLKTFQAQSAAQQAQLTQQVELMKNERDNEQHKTTELLKNNQDNQTAILVKRLELMQAELQSQVQDVATKQETAPSIEDTMGPLIEAMTKQLGGIADTHAQNFEKLHKTLTAPKRLIRDAAGKAIGVEHASEG